MPLSREQKRKDAEKRNAQYYALSLEARLQKALKKGHEGTREVKRLRRLIEEEKKNKKK